MQIWEPLDLNCESYPLIFIEDDGNQKVAYFGNHHIIWNKLLLSIYKMMFCMVRTAFTSFKINDINGAD